MKRVLMIIITFCLCLLVMGCRTQPIDFTITCDSSVEIGKSISLTHTYDGDLSPKWDINNKEIASLEESTLKGLKVGNVTVTLTIGDVVKNKEIEIVESSIEITIEGKESGFVGENIQLSASTSFETDEVIKWSSSDEKIATVDKSGLVSLVSSGSTTITAEVLGKTCDYVITVNEIIEYIEISGEKFVGIGMNTTLSVDTNITNEINWTSSDESIASVDSNGKVSGKKTGEVTIYAQGNDVTSEFTLTVFDIDLSGNKSVYVQDVFKLDINTSVLDYITWEVSDDSLAVIDEDGNITAIKPGIVTIYAKAFGYVASFEVEIKEKITYIITLQSKNVGYIGDTFKIKASVEPSLENASFEYKSSDDSIASVSLDGVVALISKGVVTITVSLEDDMSISSTLEITVNEKDNIVCDLEMMQGAYNYLKFYKDGEEVTEGLTWSVNDPKLAIVSGNIMLGVNKGIVTVTCKGTDINESVDVTIKEYVSEKPSSEDLARVEEILSNMTLSQKVGQMFVVGLGGTSLGNDLKSAVQKCNFGNVIYMGYNVTSPGTLASLSNDIQKLLIEKNTVPGFICTDQEGGRVARLTNGGTHFISNMAMAGTGDFTNTYLEGVAMGKELRNYGINVDFAPVLDVNNNPNNPIIGIRSYSDNPLKVGLFGVNMFTGLQSENVMGCSKHFPGHGNTSTDSHYGLPKIDTGINELYQTELAPFISAVSNGIDSIMTTHIIFSAIDKTYPATLSEKVLTGLLREELGFDGLIITDGMEMAAVTENFGGADEIAVLAVKAGVDILTYTSNNTPQTAYNGIMAAIKKGEITEERINESVRRILLKKIKYDVLDGYTAKNDNITEMLEEHNELNIKFAMDSLTQVRGTFNGIDKSKKVLVISPTTTYDLGSNVNSFANYASNYLKLNGYTCDYEEVSTNIKASDSSRIVEKAKGYDVVVVAMSNVKTSNYSRSANFVNSLAKLNNELVVIALDTPYDILSYSGVDNYICVYGYQKATVIALSRYLNGEFKAVGVCPVEAVK